MPFITEELYLNLPGSEETVMHAAWPQYDPALAFPREAAAMESVMDLIRSIRNIRAEKGVPPSRKANIAIVAHEAKDIPALEACIPYILKLGGAEQARVKADKASIAKDAVSAVSALAEAFIPLADLIDLEKEKERMGKEAERIRGEIARGESKLTNEGFVAKAPAKVIEEERTKLENNKTMLEKLEARIQDLGS
jgi:valyl-tRNA synthetase